MEQANDETAAALAASLGEASERATGVEPMIAEVLRETARAIAQAPDGVDAWDWLAARNDPIAQVVVVFRAELRSGTWPTTPLRT